MRRTATALLVAGVLAGCGQGAVPAAGERTAAGGYVVPRDGDTVAGTGRLVQAPGEPFRFCGVESSPAVGYLPGQEPPPQDCPDGVRLDDVAPADLPDPREKAGAVQAYAWLTGTWRDGGVQVAQVRPPDNPELEPERIPCPEPAGGWPQAPPGDNLDAVQGQVGEQLPHLLVPGKFALLRPSDTQVLLGVRVQDEAARARAQAELDQLVPGRACVVVARFSDAEVAAAEAVDWLGFAGVRGWGTGGDAMQAVVLIDVGVVTDELAAAAAENPDALVAFQPALQVVPPGPTVVD